MFSSLSEPDTTAFKLYVLPFPTEPLILPSKSSIGFLVVTITAPPMAPRPYSAPCAPRITSIRSISTRSWFINSKSGAVTPSTTNANGGSPTCGVIKPRIVIRARPGLKLSSCDKLGVKLATSRKLVIRDFSIVSALNAVTESGTFCIDSTRPRDITEIFSIVSVTVCCCSCACT